jgi:hypothetical protein
MPVAWEGNWAERIGERVRAKGFASLLEFSEARPTATFLELADELGEEDVAAVQIEWVLKDEALERNSFARFARASLVRTIYEQLPQGWGIGKKADFRRAGVYADWRGTLGPEYNDATDRVFDALETANPPRGWLPAGADDPIIDKAFLEGQFDNTLESATKNVGGPR